MKKLDQSGNHIVIVLLVVLIVSVLGVGGYYVYSKNKDSQEDNAANTTQMNDSESSVADTAEEELITTTVTTVLHEGSSLKVTHPKSWEVKQATKDNGDYQLRDSYIKSEKGNYLYIREIEGIGGACELGERTDTFTLKHRFGTAIPGVVFSEYEYSDQTQTTALKLENHNSTYIDASVVAMKEGDTLTDTCRLYIYPVVPLIEGNGLFVSVSKGSDLGESLLPENLTYDELVADPEFMKAVQTLSK